MSWRVLRDVAHTLGPASATRTHTRGCVPSGPQQAGSRRAAARPVASAAAAPVTPLSACRALREPCLRFPGLCEQDERAQAC